MALDVVNYYFQGHGTRLYLKPLKAWTQARTKNIQELINKNYALNIFNLNPQNFDFNNTYGWSAKEEEVGRGRNKSIAKWKQFDYRENSQTLALQGVAYPYMFDLIDNGLAGVNNVNALQEQNAILNYLEELDTLATNGTRFEVLIPTKEQGTKTLGTYFIASLEYSKTAFIKDSDCLKLPYNITLEKVN